MTDTLPVGRELDALVAENVMGCRVKWRTYGLKGRYPYCDCVGHAGVHNDTDEQNDDMLASYSTDISAAWQVVEKVGLFHRYGDCLTYDHDSKKWQIGKYWREYDGVALDVTVDADTAPHAICLAALKAVGYEVQA